jgi:hypothetical protein
MSADTNYVLEKIQAIAMALPGSYEKTSYGTPAFFVKKKLYARIKEDGTTLVVYNNERDEWIAKDPDTFFITHHYRNYPLLLINLLSIKQAALKEMLHTAWAIRCS